MDVYKKLASQIFDIPIEEVTSEQRLNIKRRFYYGFYTTPGVVLRKNINLNPSEVTNIFNSYMNSYKRNK